MTIENRMAEGSQPVKRQKCDEPHAKDGPTDLVMAMAVKLTTVGDINIPKFHRSDSDDEPITPLDKKLSDSEITDDMKVPTKQKKKKEKESKEKTKEKRDT